jgi:hypothetical protein
MKLLVFRSLWGMTGRIEDQIAQIAAEGYDGVEASHQPDVITPEALRSLLERYRLKLIMGASISATNQLESALSALIEYQPLRIGLHSGRDSMSHSDGAAFLEQALKIEQKIGLPVAHETHRGRLFFTPWDTLHYLQAFPELKVVADFSHWVNVCERLPDDQRGALQLAGQRAIHVHGRVGYEEGPQVPDPSAPEYATQLVWHEAQWQAIWDAHQQRSEGYMTFTPEYGPPGYLHTLPHTNVPVANLSQVCLWAANRARQQFK